MVTVLLAVDESPESENAARRAGELFGPGANYLAVNVAEYPVAWYPTPMAWGGVYAFAAPYPLVEEELGASADDERREARDVAAAAATHADVRADAVGVTGDPVTAILQAADEHRADVIVVGASDKSWWQRLFEGSVSADVAKRARRPVLLVHADSDDDQNRAT